MVFGQAVTGALRCSLTQPRPPLLRSAAILGSKLVLPQSTVFGTPNKDSERPMRVIDLTATISQGFLNSCQQMLRKSAPAVGSRSTASKRRDAGARLCVWTRRRWRNCEHDFTTASVKLACEG